MYDELLKSKLDYPKHYDRMVVLIMLHNPHCTGRDWALDAINICIRGALERDDTSTAMCHAERTSRGIRIFLEPLSSHLDGLASLVNK